MKIAHELHELPQIRVILNQKFCRCFTVQGAPGGGAETKMSTETTHHTKHRPPSLPCKCLPTQWGWPPEAKTY